MKTENLKAAYADLKNGCTIDCNGCVIWIDYGRNWWDKKQYIFWQNYGQSAERLGINNLRFIMRDIAKSDDYSYKVLDI